MTPYIRHLIAPATLAELFFVGVFVACAGLLAIGFGD